MTQAGLAARAAALVRIGAAAAILGGALRIVSTFVPYEADSVPLEALYGLIDVCLMFGLIAVYVASAAAVGFVGLAAFLVSLAGIASIVGPDTQAFGIDLYRVGALVFVAGLAGLSVQLLRARMMGLSAVLWIATLVAGLVSAVVPAAFVASGLCLGVGYVLAGVEMLRMRAIPHMAHA